MEATKLPPYIYGREAGPNEKVWTEDAVRGVLQAVPAGVELPDDGELEAWRQAADTLLSRKDPGQHELRRAAMLLQNAYLFASKLRGTPGMAPVPASPPSLDGERMDRLEQFYVSTAHEPEVWRQFMQRVAEIGFREAIDGVAPSDERAR